MQALETILVQKGLCIHLSLTCCRMLGKILQVWILLDC